MAFEKTEKRVNVKAVMQHASHFSKGCKTASCACVDVKALSSNRTTLNAIHINSLCPSALSLALQWSVSLIVESKVNLSLDGTCKKSTKKP